MSKHLLTRRQALGGMAALIAGHSLARGRPGPDAGAGAAGPDPGIESSPRLAPRTELVLVREFEDSARFVLPGPVFSTIAGGDHRAFARITVRPRVMIPTLDMDLSVEILGTRLPTPILVGPVSDQRRYHADAELATARGASAGKAAMVVSSRSSVPIERVAAEAKTPLWFQADAEPGAKARIDRAVAAGCKAVCVTLGAVNSQAEFRPDWAAIAELRRGIGVPVLVKGILAPAEAEAAVRSGVQGIIVSGHGRPGAPASITALPPVLDAVGGRVPVLVDGGFELGVDIFKALAFGARGVLVARPAMWGLAAYGADGVQSVLEMLQCDLGRAMAMCGNPTVPSLDRSRLRIHARESA